MLGILGSRRVKVDEHVNLNILVTMQVFTSILPIKSLSYCVKNIRSQLAIV